ncbi:sec-independent translocase [Streptomyces sp. H27-D2]|uniref:sec-independent translocase n=1 Tax=Streptomyces sp. H27-D2 TaxID=3046304 RepID=UPI002DBBB116|nr:sec-independent translocase [Streptomyces sp. H27-D2]MEC4019246.1 sec-independent translocase [Streptomyces sp. H27-D2]
MFFDIGALEVVALVILAVLIFGPDKLPKVIKDVTGFIRKIREFSDSAKEDIRSELGPEFKDFEFDDLNPKNFVRKQFLENDDLGLQEIRNGFDLKKEMADLTDAVTGRESSSAGSSSADAGATAAGSADRPSGSVSTASVNGSPDTPNRLRKSDPLAKQDPPPFDSDAT